MKARKAGDSFGKICRSLRGLVDSFSTPSQGLRPGLYAQRVLRTLENNHDVNETLDFGHETLDCFVNATTIGFFP